MKLLLILAIVATAAYASSSDESSFTEQSDPETMLLNVQNTIATMKKKGATASDCKDLAKTTCKEVERDQRTRQKTLDALDNGSKCNNIGKTAHAQSARAFKVTNARYIRSKATVRTGKKARVWIPISSLSRGKITAAIQKLLSSRSVINARRKISAALKKAIVMRSKTAAARKARQTAAKVARKMQKACHCNAQKAARKVWKVVSAKKLKQARVHQMCKMMSCVLAGTNTKARKCQGSLTPLRKKKLSSATARAKCGPVPVRARARAKKKRSSSCKTPTARPSWIKRPSKHCARNKHSNTPFQTLALAEAACAAVRCGRCHGVYDAACDNKGPFYLCRASTGWGKSFGTTFASCVYQKLPGAT